MEELLRPLRTDSLTDVFVSRFEELILSGKLTIGQRLPSERELALMLRVSRPVVHEGLVVLVQKGLVAMKPRVGTVVSDYRRSGSLALLTSLLTYAEGPVGAKLLDDVLQLRRLLEVEAARLAARHRTAGALRDLEQHLARETPSSPAGPADPAALAAADFDFHHLVALATGSSVYPLLFHSFRPLFVNLAGRFYSSEAILREVHRFHAQVVEAIAAKDEEGAADAMRRMLDHGARTLARAQRKGGKP